MASWVQVLPTIPAPAVPAHSSTTAARTIEIRRVETIWRRVVVTSLWSSTRGGHGRICAL